MRIMIGMATKQNPESYDRQCPGQNYVISDAVCRTRQARNFPQCEGCVHRDATDDVSKPKLQRPKTLEKGNAMDAIFKAYDVRGTVPEQLDEHKAWSIGYATAQSLRAQLSGYDRTDPALNSLVVGRDMRKSSPALSKAFIEGARSGGVNVVDIGMIDTAQIYFAVNHIKCCGGVQTTASHNPGHYNGFKVTGVGGKPIGSDTGLMEIKRIAAAVPARSATVQGKLTTMDMAEPYKKFIRSFLRGMGRKMKVAIDASNGMAGKWWPIVFGDIAELETIQMNFEHNGDFVHDPNPLVAENLKQLRQAVRDHRADFGICFDGDADRMMIIDERAEIVPCDLMTALLGKAFLQWNPGTTIVYDLRSSWVVKEEVERLGGTPRRERVGHSFMKRAMAEAGAAFGGELSGHFYFKDNAYCDSAFLAVVGWVNILNQSGRQTMSQLVQPLRRLFASGERNFECEDKDARIKQLAEKYATGQIDYLDGITIQFADWWLNVRKSNTEPLLRLNLEARTARLLDEKLKEIAPLLGHPAAH